MCRRTCCGRSTWNVLCTDCDKWPANGVVWADNCSVSSWKWSGRISIQWRLSGTVGLFYSGCQNITSLVGGERSQPPIEIQAFALFFYIHKRNLCRRTPCSVWCRSQSGVRASERSLITLLLPPRTSKWPARGITARRRTRAPILHSTQRCCDTAAETSPDSSRLSARNTRHRHRRATHVLWVAMLPRVVCYCFLNLYTYWPPR